MVKIEILLAEGKISKINELEIGRYINFLDSSYQDNLRHAEAVWESFPRWSIISAYYSMHDITKLLIAKHFSLKIELEVHATTIKVLQELIKQEELLKLMEKGYQEFLSLANDLAEAKKERVKVQYYTGTEYMKEEYRKRAQEFLQETAKIYVNKVNLLLRK